MNAESSATDESYAAYRDALVDDLIRREWIHNGPVASAMRSVSRHAFVPEVSVETAYRDEVVVTKRNAQGKPISSASQPWIVGMMLEQLNTQPGHRILEIGAGTGYNAALLAHLVGENGKVTTMDFDQDVADRAHAALVESGCNQVKVVCGDGERGFAAQAPYDRIIVTVGAADLPRAWFDQLAIGGFLVVPLRIRGSQRVIAFERTQFGWRSTSIVFGGFMPIRGIGAQSVRTVPLRKEIGDSEHEADLTIQIDEDQSVDGSALASAFAQPFQEARTGVGLSNVGTGKRETSEWLELWLTFSFPGYAHIGASDQARERGLVNLPYRFFYSPAIFDQENFAYLATLPSDAVKEGHEFVVRAYGQNAKSLAERVSEQIQRWNRDYRHSRPCIKARYLDSSESVNDQLVIEKTHVRLTATWPESDIVVP